MQYRKILHTCITLICMALYFSHRYVAVQKLSSDLYITYCSTCKSCVKCGKGFKIGTNEANNIKIKNRVGAFFKFSAFVRTPIWLPQTKAFH